MNPNDFQVSGNLIDVVNRRIYPATVHVVGGKISEIMPLDGKAEGFILPGLIDAHIHIESSMLVPSEFARIAVVHGTTAVVSDPHEIANVVGTEGVRFMIDNARLTPFRFFFGAPSCVPATSFETAGATLGFSEVEELLSWKEIYYLSEMMNFPGVLYDDPEIKTKLQAALVRNKPIDGHAPGLRGEALEKYYRASITTDHECFTLDEAREKAALGMKVLIREGSAARNFDELIPLIGEYPEMVMFCSDDKHPDDLFGGHINKLVASAVQQGYDILDVISACTLNPVRHYGLPCGLLQPGDPADFIVVESLESMNVLETYIKGIKVAGNGQSYIDPVNIVPVNRFVASPISPSDLEIAAEGDRMNIIEVIDGQIVTKKTIGPVSIVDGKAVCDPEQDILKIAVINRYHPSKPAVGFVKNFGLKKGALASTVAHDSHNIIAVGTSDEELATAINQVIGCKGGIVAFSSEHSLCLPLPVGGLMALDDARTVAEKYKKLDAMAKSMGSKLSAPFMTLSFMALLVIPELKISDKGLFDGGKFQFIPLFTGAS